MKCSLCNQRGKEVDISDRDVRELHAKHCHPTLIGDDLEVLAEPFRPRLPAQVNRDEGER